jgi:multiple sugar transport system permease protein
MEAKLTKPKKQPKVKARKEKITVSHVVLIVILTILALFTLIPFFWMLSASFKTNNAVFAIPMDS